ncbi:MAG: hypothetical protein AAB971_02780 [Patescibacteria group bacterium]
MTGSIKELEGFCPVPAEQRTPEAMDRFTAKVLVTSGIQIPEEFAHLVEPDDAEKHLPKPSIEIISAQLQPDRVKKPEIMQNPQQERPAKLKIMRSPDESELAAAVHEQDRQMHLTMLAPQLELIKPVPEEAGKEPKSLKPEPGLKPVVAPRPRSTTIQFIPEQPSPTPTLKAVPAIEQLAPPNFEESPRLQITPIEQPPTEPVSQPVKAVLSKLEDPQPTADGRIEEFLLTDQTEIVASQTETTPKAAITNTDVNTIESVEIAPVEIALTELILSKAADTVELSDQLAEQTETLIDDLPPTLQQRLMEYVVEAEDQTGTEIIEILVIEIAPLADRLHELAMTDQTDSEEAIQIKQALSDWLEELSVRLEIETNDMTITEFIETICSQTYGAKAPKADDLIDQSLHERKYRHKPFDITSTTKTIVHVAEVLEQGLARLMVRTCTVQNH